MNAKKLSQFSIEPAQKRRTHRKRAPNNRQIAAKSKCVEEASFVRLLLLPCYLFVDVVCCCCHFDAREMQRMLSRELVGERASVFCLGRVNERHRENGREGGNEVFDMHCMCAARILHVWYV